MPKGTPTPNSRRFEIHTRPTAGWPVSFVNVAREAGLRTKTIFGGEKTNRFLLETTGCGCAFRVKPSAEAAVMTIAPSGVCGSFVAGANSK